MGGHANGVPEPLFFSAVSTSPLNSDLTFQAIPSTPINKQTNKRFQQVYSKIPCLLALPCPLLLCYLTCTYFLPYSWVFLPKSLPAVCCHREDDTHTALPGTHWLCGHLCLSRLLYSSPECFFYFSDIKSMRISPTSKCSLTSIS